MHACGYVGRCGGRLVGVRGGHSAAAAPGTGLVQEADGLAEESSGPGEQPPRRLDSFTTGRCQFTAHAALTQRITSIRRTANW